MDASEIERFGPLGVAMLASCFATRRAAGRETTLIPPLNVGAAEFLDEVGFERVAHGGARVGTLELRQMHNLDALYTQNVAEMLVTGVPSITDDNSYPIQLCLNELLQNVFEWSNSRVGCFVLARWFKQTRSVRLAVVDRGIGIPAALRRAQIQDLQRSADSA
jgi:signal transduction histidine kinase